MRTARRIDAIPPYLFAEIDRKIAERKAAGVDVISFGVGDPDLPTPDFVVEELARAAGDLDPPVPELLRAAVVPARGRRLLPAPLRGRARPGHPGPAPDRLQGGDRPPAVGVRRPGRPGAGDRAGLPGVRGRDDPGRRASRCTSRSPPRAAGSPTSPPSTRRRPRAKLLCTANPTGAVATADQLERVRFAADRDLLLAYDNAYSEITYDGFVAPSVLRVPGATDVALEFGSLSKIFNMTGWRIGWAVGSPVAIERLRAGSRPTSTRASSTAVQRAGSPPWRAACRTCPGCWTYRRRRDRIMEVFWDAGWKVEAPRAPCVAADPAGESSVDFTARLLDEAGVVGPRHRLRSPAARATSACPSPSRRRLEEGCERVRKALVGR